MMFRLVAKLLLLVVAWILVVAYFIDNDDIGSLIIGTALFVFLRLEQISEEIKRGVNK